MVKKYFECQSTDSNTILHVVSFTPSNMESAGAIQIVHGMTEHLDQYDELGEYFTNKGYAAEIHIGTGHQPTIVLGLLEKYLRSKYRNAMKCSSDEIEKLAFNNYNNKFKDMPDNYWLLTDEKSREKCNS